MAKFFINHTCGHESVAQIYGTNVHGERDKKAEWMASRPCADCLRAANLNNDAEQGYADLQGTEKQIGWASQIRRKCVEQILSTIEIAKTQGVPAQSIAEAERVAEFARNFDDAKYWIDHRDENLAGLMYQQAVTK